jgi:hypothetical protein
MRPSGLGVDGGESRHRPMRRLLAGARHPGTRAASGPALGALRPLREELAAWGCAGLRISGSVGPKPKNAAAERREARWPAIRLVISGGPEMGPIARRAIGCGGFRTSALSALCSPHFFKGAEERTRGTRPLQPGRRSVGCLTIEDDGYVARMSEAKSGVVHAACSVPHVASLMRATRLPMLRDHRYGASSAMFLAISRSQRSPFASRRSLS